MLVLVLALSSISIHAPRTGSDFVAHVSQNHRDISIHAPRTGSDLMAVVPTSRVGFQSTLPARGATYSNMESALTSGISIHAPRTGSDGCGGRVWVLPDISIHAPRTGSDSASNTTSDSAGTFQSTLPARGATDMGGEEVCKRGHFNPRSPHGERPRQ